MEIKDLKTIISEDLYHTLVQEIEIHARQSNIHFEVVFLDDNYSVIRVEQFKTSNDTYFSRSRIVEIVHETFDVALAPRTIKVHPLPYIQNPCDIINDKYLHDLMGKLKIRNKEFEKAFGIHRSKISNWINGSKPMGQTVRAMFYYYLVSKGYILEM